MPRSLLVRGGTRSGTPGPSRDRNIEVDLVDGFLQLRDRRMNVRAADRSIRVTRNSVVLDLRQSRAVRRGLLRVT